MSVLDKIKYKFENKAMLKISEKLLIAMTNPLVCYLIVQISYIRPLIITKLIFISIEFEVPRKASYIYDGLANP